LFRAHRGVRVRPLRPADRTQQHGIGGATGVEGGGGQRLASGVDGGAADQMGLEAEFMAEPLRDLPCSTRTAAR
jgi:hypothetical protein